MNEEMTAPANDIRKRGTDGNISSISGPSPRNLRWAGFWVRELAYFLDLIILTLLFIFLAFVGESAMDLGLKIIYQEAPSGKLVLFLLGLYLLVWLLLYLAYFIYFLKTTGQTPGKKLLGIKVIQKNRESLTWSAVLLRTAGYFVSGFLLMGIGFIFIAFHPQKRGLHDLMAGTMVIHE